MVQDVRPWCPAGGDRLPVGPRATEQRGTSWFVVQHTCACGRILHRLVVNCSTGKFVINRHKPPVRRAS